VSIRHINKQKSNIMTHQVKRFYKGELFTLTVRGNDLAYAHNEEGYVVCNPKLLHLLANL
jgi:hypothetical protein